MRRSRAIAMVAYALAAVSTICSATAQNKSPPDSQKQAPASFTVISPIFGQLVMFAHPARFRPVHESSKGDRYIREVVPTGQTVEAWSEMITVTGAKGLAAVPHSTPRAFVEQIGGGFRRACPETFSSRVIGETQFGGHDAFIAIVGCGVVKSAPSPRSEAALLIALKGAADMYTIQWAERGAASDKLKVEIDETWSTRLKSLGPIRLCPIVAGEKAPYPSCVNWK